MGGRPGQWLLQQGNGILISQLTFMNLYSQSQNVCTKGKPVQGVADVRSACHSKLHKIEADLHLLGVTNIT